jgi:hypothetical protein
MKLLTRIKDNFLRFCHRLSQLLSFKMSFDNYKLNTSENVETIRALISSRGRNGATLQELRGN